MTMTSGLVDDPSSNHRREHAHAHALGHSHAFGANGGTGSKLLISAGLTATVFVAELVGGYWTHSLALLSDAWHVLADVLALGLSWYALRQVARRPTEARSYGFHRAEVMSAMVNGLSLLAIGGGIIYEAVRRFMAPEAVKGPEMLAIAVVGLGANGLIALVLMKSAGDSLNVRSAFLHVIGDALSSVAVIVGGILVIWLGWNWVDPVISLLISLMILRGAANVTAQAFRILMEGTPPEVRLGEAKAALAAIAGVEDVHDLHIWDVSSQVRAATVHLIVPDADRTQTAVDAARRMLRDRFGVAHATVQVEQRCDLTGELLCRMEHIG